MIKYVVSKKVALELEKSGFITHTRWAWVRDAKKDILCETQDFLYTVEKIAAPLSDEILKQLPKSIVENGNKYDLLIRFNSDNDFIPYYYDSYNEETLGTAFNSINERHIPDALAQLWLWLKKNDYLDKDNHIHEWELYDMVDGYRKMTCTNGKCNKSRIIKTR